jgi:DNA-binding XRE family transcriptional regulator
MKKDDTKKSLALELLRYRFKHSITQDQLAIIVGKCRKTICRWENGKTKPHQVDLIGLQIEGIVPEGNYGQE